MSVHSIEQRPLPGYGLGGNALGWALLATILGLMGWVYVKLGGIALLLTAGLVVVLTILGLGVCGMIAWVRCDSDQGAEAFELTYRRMWRRFYGETAIVTVAVIGMAALVKFVSAGWPGPVSWTLSMAVLVVGAFFGGLWLLVTRKPEDIELEYEYAALSRASDETQPGP